MATLHEKDQQILRSHAQQHDWGDPVHSARRIPAAKREIFPPYGPDQEDTVIVEAVLRGRSPEFRGSARTGAGWTGGTE